MKFDYKEKRILKVLIVAILFYFAVLRIDSLIIFVRSIVSLAKPFIIGGAIAFVLNLPMKKIESLMEKTKINKGRRIRAFLVTVVLMATVAGIFLLIVVPQLGKAMETLITRLQFLSIQIPAFFEANSGHLTVLEEYINSLDIDWQQMGQNTVNRLKTFAVGIMGSSRDIIGSIVSGFTTLFLSVIFSVYILFGKEKIGGALKDFTCAVFKTEICQSIFHVLSVANKSFSSFLTGQCLEAVILGSIFIAAMLITGMPYAFLIGIIIAVTALIPVFGAFIGCGVGIMLIALENPVQALWFVLMFLVLQQIEGNFIYPRVVGNSIGLPGILVFMSVIVGSSLMGVVGMLLFIPLVSVMYILTKEYVLSKKNQNQAVSE